MREARPKEIRYYQRESGGIGIEQVHQGHLIDWLYNSRAGAIVCRLLAGFPGYSQACGLIKNLPGSKKQIDAFVSQYQIRLADFLPEEGRDESDPYASFNAFFIRRYRPGLREFKPISQEMPAFCEGRYLGSHQGSAGKKLPVKGQVLSPSQLLARSEWEEVFRGGPFLIARLSPVDYHRFHFPDEGTVLEHYPIHGSYHSVNPIALNKKPDILVKNERQITIMATKNFGRLAYVEVGAMSVGKIVQTHVGNSFQRGEEKGFFRYGGSTVVVLGEKGKWQPSADIAEHSAQGLETLVKLGDQVASAN